MSYQATNWVFKHSPARNGHRLVLLAIAHHANPDGTGAWPTLRTISAETGISRRRVQLAIAELEETGALAVNRGTGRRSSRYTILNIQPDLFTAVNQAAAAAPPAPVEDTPATAPEAPAEEPPHDTPGASFSTSRGDPRLTTNYPEESVKDTQANACVAHAGVPKRPRDPVWDVLVDIYGPAPPGRTERGKWNRAARELKEIGASPSEISWRAAVYDAKWPHLEATPMALVSNWSRLEQWPEQLPPRRRAG